MALPDLLRALREQAAEVRAAELEDARTEAARIRAESAAALERRRTDFVEHARREEAEIAQRAVARAQAEAAEAVLAARDRLLTRVRSALEERIASADGDEEYRTALHGELRSAVDRLPAGPVVVRTPPGLREHLREAADGLDRVSVEPAAEIDTGFVALAADGRVEVDATLETRLEYAWPRLAVGVVREVAL